MITRLVIALCLVCGLAVGYAAAAINEDVFMIPTIVVEQPLHFTGADGTDVVAGPGIYRVESRGESLIVLVKEVDQHEVVLQALTTGHESVITEPVALLAPTDEDTVHLVLLLPDGKRREAVGSVSGTRSRAPSAPLSSTQVSQAMAGVTASGQLTTQVGVIGGPSPPVLVSPVSQARLAQFSIEFQWTQGTGQPAPTSFQLCIAEAGKPCARPGETSPTSIVIPNIRAGDPGFRVSILDAETLLLPYRGERSLTWTIAACAPAQFVPQTGSANSISCRYASSLPLFWKPVLLPPLLVGDSRDIQVVNDRPEFSFYGIRGTHHFLFCIAPASVDCGQQGSLVMNTGTRTSLTGREWSTLPNSQNSTGLPLHIFAGKEAWWRAAACLDDTNCSWANPAPVKVLPAPSLNGLLSYTYSTATQHEFFWSVPPQTQSWATHYRLCFATQGSRFVNRQGTLIDIPGMLRDLCSDDIPPGDQPAYLKPVPANLASFCPPSGCRMPEPVTTISTTQPRWIIDLREHPEWDRLANQPIVWTAAACNGSNRNCMWQTGQHGTISFPLASHAPSLSPTRSGQPVTLNWGPVVGNAYYVPCVRETNGSCETGNLLGHPRLISSGASPSDHPSTCTLRGPYQTGSKVVQVAGCNDAWGCRWSDPQIINLEPNQAPHRNEPKFDCR